MPETIEQAMFRAERYGHPRVTVPTSELRALLDQVQELSDTVAALQASAPKSSSTQDAE